MWNRGLTALSLIFVLATVSCARNTPVPTPCPALPPIPPELLAPMEPTLLRDLQNELLDPQQPETGR